MPPSAISLQVPVLMPSNRRVVVAVQGASRKGLFDAKERAVRTSARLPGSSEVGADQRQRDGVVRRLRHRLSDRALRGRESQHFQSTRVGDLQRPGAAPGASVARHHRAAEGETRSVLFAVLRRAGHLDSRPDHNFSGSVAAQADAVGEDCSAQTRARGVRTKAFL